MSAQPMAPRLHGGPDAQGAAAWDFSTNANACGPCPEVLDALRQVDRSRYPDPSYAALRRLLAHFHGVDTGRVLVAASASEAIQRLTAWTVRWGGRRVAVPSPAYGDYAHAALAWGLAVSHHGEASSADADLSWHCDPASPTGQGGEPPRSWSGVSVLDRAYEALRLEGASAWPMAALDRVWQLWSPNKALALTGVRGAYFIAPDGAQDAVSALEALAPSWPLGADGVAMLSAWSRPSVQAWLVECRSTLRVWREQLQAGLAALGWHALPSQTPYACYRPPHPLDLDALRVHGVRLRDTTSMGLPAHYRLNALSPNAQIALLDALRLTNPGGAPLTLAPSLTA